MATEVKVIKVRRGAYTDFDKTKMNAGEPAVTTSGDPNAIDGKGVYMGVGPGQVKQVAMIEDIEDILNNAVDGAVDEATQQAKAEADRAEAAATQLKSTVQQVATNTANITELNERLSDVKDDLTQLFTNIPFEQVQNSYWLVSGNAGYPGATSGWSRTNRLPCVPGETLKIQTTVNSIYNLFFNTDTDGDMNKSFSVESGLNEIVVPDNAYYYALSNTTAAMNNTTISRVLDAQGVTDSIQENTEAIQENSRGIDKITNAFNEYINDGFVPVEYDTVSNEYVNAASGEFASYNGWVRTDYIPTTPGKTYYYSNTVESGYNCFYNADKTRISSFILNVSDNGNFTVPANVAYMALSNTDAGMRSLSLKSQLAPEIKIVGVEKPYYAIQGLESRLNPVKSLSFKFDSISFSVNGVLYTKTWSDLKNVITVASLEYDQLKVKDVKYILPGRSKLVITADGSFAWSYNPTNTSDTVVGINLDASPIYAFGAIIDYAQKEVFDLMREINEEIPTDAIDSLNNAEELLYSQYTENDFLMAYYSDNHMYGLETGAECPITALAINRLDNHMDFDSILCCGDSVLSHAQGSGSYIDDGSAYTALKKGNFMINREKLLFVEGNHDRNIYSPVMTTREFINLMYRPLSKITDVHFGGTGKPYFYRDFPKHKIRIVCLDLYDVLPDEGYAYHSGYKQDQMVWLANTALALPDNTWHVLVATHAAPYGEDDGMTDNGTPPYNSNVLIGILESFKNGTSVTINSTATITEFPSYSITTNFSTAGNLIGCFVGHNHVDVNLVKNGIHYVSIECAYVEDNDKANRNAFEYSAIAFDVVVINTENKSVNMHRIGYGNDRSYTY